MEIVSYVPPKSHERDIQRAIAILKEEDCGEVYIFGSLALDRANEESDIDIGLRSYPRERFFNIYGKLMAELEHSIDLMDFEHETSFYELLLRLGELKRIA